MTTCWPPVPSKVYRSAKCAPPDVNTGDTQSPTVSAPGIGACPTAIGAPVNVLHAMKVPVKSSSSVVVKSRDGGAKMKLPRLGVARYVVPISNPVWDHTPDESVCTGGGTAPVPPALNTDDTQSPAVSRPRADCPIAIGVREQSAATARGAVPIVNARTIEARTGIFARASLERVSTFRSPP